MRKLEENDKDQGGTIVRKGIICMVDQRGKGQSAWYNKEEKDKVQGGTITRRIRLKLHSNVQTVEGKVIHSCRRI